MYYNQVSLIKMGVIGLQLMKLKCPLPTEMLGSHGVCVADYHSSCSCIKRVTLHVMFQPRKQYLRHNYIFESILVIYFFL